MMKILIDAGVDSAHRCDAYEECFGHMESAGLLMVWRLAKAGFLITETSLKTQQFATLRSGGFSAQKFNRRTAREPTIKLSFEAQHQP